MNINKLCVNIYKHLNYNNNIKSISPILEKYNAFDFRKFIEFDKKNYKKNLITTNNLFDMYLICWNNYQFSNIHKHPEKGCIMKVLENGLEEKIYDNTYKNIEIKYIKKNDISYIDNEIGLHSIHNNNNKSISLHIYGK